MKEESDECNKDETVIEYLEEDSVFSDIISIYEKTFEVFRAKVLKEVYEYYKRIEPSEEELRKIPRHMKYYTFVKSRLITKGYIKS
jgi:hypothetical protein